MARYRSICGPAHLIRLAARLFLAQTARSPRCSDSVSFLRDFCRAENASGWLTLDPEQKCGSYQSPESAVQHRATPTPSPLGTHPPC